jgi:hypothetical protein
MRAAIPAGQQGAVNLMAVYIKTKIIEFQPSMRGLKF